MKYTIVDVSSRFLQRPQKVKSREPAYSQVLNQNKSIDTGSTSRESVRRLWFMVFEVQRGREVWGRGYIRILIICESAVFIFRKIVVEMRKSDVRSWKKL